MQERGTQLQSSSAFGLTAKHVGIGTPATAYGRVTPIYAPWTISTIRQYLIGPFAFPISVGAGAAGRLRRGRLPRHQAQPPASCAWAASASRALAADRQGAVPQIRDLGRP